VGLHLTAVARGERASHQAGQAAHRRGEQGGDPFGAVVVGDPRESRTARARPGPPPPGAVGEEHHVRDRLGVRAIEGTALDPGDPSCAAPAQTAGELDSQLAARLAGEGLVAQAPLPAVGMIDDQSARDLPRRPLPDPPGAHLAPEFGVDLDLPPLRPVAARRRLPVSLSARSLRRPPWRAISRFTPSRADRSPRRCRDPTGPPTPHERPPPDPPRSTVRSSIHTPPRSRRTPQT